ncbi:MAG TPA: aquaporin [Thermoplasmata archaeon]|nr:aquaporin [Thermoplasmata archaeon]
MAATASQRYLAEFLGTFALLLMGDGAAVLSLTLWSGSISLDPNARVVLISLAFGVTVLGGAYAFGEISGGHFNPAVTLSMALSRRMPLRDVVPYIIAQVVGGLLGVLTVLGIAYGYTGSWTNAQATGIGSQGYSGNGAPYLFSMGSVFLIELGLTFLFVLVIQLVTRPESGAKNLAPAAIGLTLMVANLVAIPVDGASLNPARSFAPALLAAYWSSAQWAIKEVWLFWVAPILGGLLASIVEMMFRPRTSG